MVKMGRLPGKRVVLTSLMQKWAVCYRGVIYRYVLSILDVFSHPGSSFIGICDVGVRWSNETDGGKRRVRVAMQEVTAEVDFQHFQIISSSHHSHALIGIYFCRNVEEEALIACWDIS